MRDYIVRGERANDIDVEVASMTHLEAVQSALITALTRRQLPVTAVRPKGMAVCVHVNVPGMDEIQVDLVRANQDQPHPGVDCSAGNLAITCSGDLVVKVFLELLLLIPCSFVDPSVPDPGACRRLCRGFRSPSASSTASTSSTSFSTNSPAGRRRTACTSTWTADGNA